MMQVRIFTQLTTLLFINFLTTYEVFSGERMDHTIHRNQVVPFSDDSAFEMEIRSNPIITSQTDDSSTASPAASSYRQSTPSSKEIVRDQRSDEAPRILTEEEVRQLITYAETLSRRIQHPTKVSDSVFENIVGVPKIKEVLTPRGLIGLLERAALVYIAYDLSDTAIGLFDFTFFKQIFGKANYYPYQAMNDGNLTDLAMTLPLYLYMALSFIPSYGAQSHDGYKRFVSFVKGCRNCKGDDLLHNPKNAWLITTISAVAAVGSGIAVFPKVYSLEQRFRETGVYGGVFQYLSLFYYSTFNFYTLFDASTTAAHSKIHKYFNGDCPITAGNRTKLLDITQNAITKWLILSDEEKTARYDRLFSVQADDTDANRLYRILFDIFDFGRPTEPRLEDLAPRPTEPKIRKGLRWFSEGVAAVVGPLSFQVIQTSVTKQLQSFGCGDEAANGVAYGCASIGSVFTTMLSRNVVSKSLTQMYDAWTGYKDDEEIASSLYASTSSGYTSHKKFRTCLTTYNQINGSLLGITMGKNVFDALPFPDWVRYPAAVVTTIASGSLETLFLQRWTHKLVNVADKNILQKINCLKPLSDSAGVKSDEFIEFVRDFRLWVTKMPAPMVQQMFALATHDGLRAAFLNPV